MPSDDFETISKYEDPRIDLEAQGSGFERVLYDCCVVHVNLVLARRALVASRERYDGLQDRMKMAEGRPALRKKLRRHLAAQVEAIVHNSLACADLHAGLVALRPAVNDEWQRLSIRSRGLTPASTKQAEKALADMRETTATVLRDKFKLPEAEVVMGCDAVRDSVARMRANGPAPIPSVLFDDEWQKATERMATHHRKTAAAYGELKERLEQVVAAGRQRPDSRP